MKKTVFKITSIFILISILNGCSSVLKYETSKENINEMGIEIQNWIRETNLKPENGNIHICRVKASEGDIYYLYFNGSKLINNSYTSYGSIGISPIEKKGLRVIIKEKESNKEHKDLFRIIVKDNTLEYIEINKKRYSIDEIYFID